MPRKDIEISLTPKQFTDLVNSICECVTGESIVDEVRRDQAQLSDFLEEIGPEEIKNIFKRLGRNVKEVRLKVEITTEKEVEGNLYKPLNKPYRMIRLSAMDEDE